MPHIRMRALDTEQAAKISEVLIKDLSTATKAAEENFTFELIETTFFAGGKKTKSYPFIEVFWFDRPQEMQDQCAKLITNRVKEIANPEDIIVVFTKLTKTDYYENGGHF